jgi:hypothetical protein
MLIQRYGKKIFFQMNKKSSEFGLLGYFHEGQ